MARDRPHIVVRDSPPAEPYRRHPQGMKPKPLPSPSDPRGHAATLKTAMEAAAADGIARRASAGMVVAGAVAGIYVLFDSPPDVQLKLESLDAQGSGIELVSVTRQGAVERAVVFVPDGKVKHFIKRFEQYANERTAKGERKNKDLVERIASLRLATLRALWTDLEDVYPGVSASIWWEVWLRVSDGKERERLIAFAQASKMTVGAGLLTFPDRVVVLVRGTAAQLSTSLDVLNDVAEVRRAKEAACGFANMTPGDLADWTKDLADRIEPASDDAPAVCVLDTGINRAHPLLAESLAAADLHAWNPAWGTDDDHGHGTEMAGLALFGNLQAPLLSGAPVALRHRLESVKILPPAGQNPPELYGAITAEAVARAEVQAPSRRRSFSLSVTADDERDRGQPSSWSAAIDAIAAGRSFDPTSHGLVYLDDDQDAQRRLFVVSAGNVDSTAIDHLSRSDTEAIRDPAQAWNALTVGACTRLDTLDPTDPLLKGHQPVARAGDLSPYSCTSVPFGRAWPIKPDVVFEGGNKVHDGHRALQHDAVSLLSTYFRPHEKALIASWATSASTAQVARFAGVLAADYPSLWPETIRALIVHSAEWTPRMLAHVPAGERRRDVEKLLLRRFGFGEPDLDRARRSATNALTLVVQDSLRPYDAGKLREMKAHALPWPRHELLELGEARVRMRVTLSYFIEPNPARRGWRTRYRYASHNLRFDVMLPTESIPDFKKRLNQLALAEGEAKPGPRSDAHEWMVGPQSRHHGSLHADIWRGTAADLALRGCVGVYPVSGWWQEQPQRDRSERGARYAMVVTIETEATDVDIYTPVATEVGVPVVIET